MSGTVLLLRMTIGATGLALLAYAILRRARAKAAERRPVVSGIILSSEVEELKLKSHGAQYRPRIEYRYTVNDVQYNSRQVYIGDDMWVSRSTEAEKTAKRYIPGTSVNVYFHPQHPEDALLEFGISSLIIRAALIGIVLIAAAVLIPL